MSPPEIEVSVAMDDYDHVRPLASGDIRIQGVRLSFHRLSRPAETFHRQLTFAEWDVSEMSLAQHCHLVAAGDDRFVGLPIFPSRRFRHSSIFVRGDSDLHHLEELAGCRVGIPEWGQTAGIWVRGMLADEHHIDLRSVAWWQGGVEEVGRPEHAEVHMPVGVELRQAADRPLADALLDGTIDAIIAARFPPALLASGAARPLLDDCRAAEIAYWHNTRLFPIMHLVVVRRALVDRHRWLAKDLVDAFTSGKDRSLERLRSMRTPMFPVPHLPEAVETVMEVFGKDPWPYGLAANRHALSTFVRYVHEQGLTDRQLHVEELFVPSSVDEFHG